MSATVSILHCHYYVSLSMLLPYIVWFVKGSEAPACCARLEATLDDLKAASLDSHDRHLLEYLFLAGSPEQLQQLAEEGFPQPPPWPLTNSLTLALQSAASPAGNCHMLIAKVLMTQGRKASRHLVCIADS